MAAWRYKNFSSRIFHSSLRSLVKYFSTQEEKFHISAQPCSIFYVLFCHLVWKHLGILTCFQLMSPERIEKNRWGFHIWDWCRQPLFFFTVQELCSEHVTLFICLLVFYVQYQNTNFYFVLFLFCCPKYFILPCVS